MNAELKSILNCHCVGVHSFPIDYVNGFYRRIYYADVHHELWKSSSIAIHSHRFDLKITVLDGNLMNKIYEKSDYGDDYKKYSFESKLLGLPGKFKLVGHTKLKLNHSTWLSKGNCLSMSSDILHTVHVPRGRICAWLVEESKSKTVYKNEHYSKEPLELWNPYKLYKECSEQIKLFYIGKYVR